MNLPKLLKQLPNLLLLLIGGWVTPEYCHAQLTISIPSDTLTIRSMVEQHFSGPGITIKEVRFEGDSQSIALFYDQKGSTGLDSGLLMCSGLAEQAAGPNARSNAGANLGHHFFTDPQLKTSTSMCDGTVLNIRFIPEHDSIHFRYVFASEEYPEFVGHDFNDIFVFFLSPAFPANAKAQNIARLPNGPIVMVNNVNQRTNKQWYIPNDNHRCPHYSELEYDGLTVPFTASARVIPGKLYQLRIIIADLGDCEYDSGVFLEMNSFTSVPSSKRKKTEVPRKNAVSKNYYFNFNSDEFTLSSTDLRLIKSMADSLRRFQVDSIRIVGHTDETGNEPRNVVLSRKRAESVAAALKRFGFTRPLNPDGKGSAHPLGSNKTKAGRALNRRVELVYYLKTSL